MDMVISNLVAEQPVAIFSKNSCCISHTIKLLIRSFGASPTVYELDELPNGKQIERALVAMGQKPSVPVVFIGQQLVGGSNEVMSLHLKGRLVPMLIQAKAIWVFLEIGKSDSKSIDHPRVRGLCHF
ncbi:hypothetical protein F0562_000882 [Nyssa sinensis]|uniref:Glutaredoxin domain-containing protein n=1 Tax=Nyssa sinensis TaxID=561372 RepID=A0A5J5C1Q7_9ASTE|nr:hypothetical protein F0562_000882 [Nyssa sinensis]